MRIQVGTRNETVSASRRLRERLCGETGYGGGYGKGRAVKRVMAAVAAGLGVFPAGWALAHGSGEIEIFRYLLEEPGFFRTAALILGMLIFLLGVFIAHQGRREWRLLRAESGEAASSRVQPMTSFQLMAPGALFAATGAAIILAAVFVLPDRIETGPRDHHMSGAMRPDTSDNVRSHSSRRGD